MGLGLKGKILIGVMAAALVGGVGSSLALTKTGAAAVGRTGAFDQAINLYWGTDQTSVDIDNVTNLQAGEPQYRYLEVSPKSSKTVAGNVTLTFTLAVADGNHHLNGLSISVYKTASLATDGTVAGLIEGKVAEPVLNASNLTGSTSFAVVADENVHETKAYYAMVINWDGSNDPAEGHELYTMSGSLTVAQSFAA